MKKITFLIALLLSAMLSAYAQAVPAYTRTVLTGQTYTQIAGGTVINTNEGLSPDLFTGNQDNGGVLVTLPFSFTYGGNTFTQVTFCTNGWVGMGDQSAVTATQSYTSDNLFVNTVPNNIIAGWFGNNIANFPAGGGSMVHGAVGTGTYAFEWRNASAINSYQSTSTINFMIVLYGPTSATPGRVEMLYGAQTGNLAGDRVIGIEGQTGGPGNFINAINGSNTLTTIANIWPGNGNGYRFDPNNTACSAITGGTIVGGNNIYACTGAAPSPIHVTGATPPLAGVTYQWQQSTDNGTTWGSAVAGSNATTLSYTPPTFNSAIRYRLKVSCGSTEAFSDVAILEGPGAPSIQASGISATYTSSGVSLAFASGNGNRRIVIASDAPIVDPTGNAAPSPAASATYSGAGQQVIYDNTTNLVTMTGVPCTGGTYYFKVYEVIRCGSAAPYTYYYNTSTTTNATTLVIPAIGTPAVQASNLTVTTAPGQLLLSWANGSGGRRRVIVSDSPNITDPVDETGVAAVTGAASYQGGQQVVLDGVTASITVTNIPCGGGGPYYIKVYEYERCGTTGNFTTKFNTTTGTNTATVTAPAIVAPTTQATNLTLTPGASQFIANWNNGNGNFRMVYIDTQPISDITDFSGPIPTADASWNDSGPQMVYSGTGSSVTVTGLSCITGDVFYVKVIEYNRCGPGSPYEFFHNNSVGTNIATYTVGAPTQATALTATQVTFNSAALTWTEGNGTGSIVVISDSPTISDPVDETGAASVVANATYQGTGQQIIYAGTANSITVNSLTCGTTYYVKVFGYFRCGTAATNNTYRYSLVTGTNTLTITPQLPIVALPQATNFEGFTGANLAATSTNWLEARIPTTAGNTPTSSNPIGITSDWLSSTVFGFTTARVNMVARTKNEWLISPKTTITGPSRIKFKAAITAANSVAVAAAAIAETDDNVRVLINTDGCGNNWTELYAFNNVTAATLSNAFVDFSIPVEGAYIGQTVQIAFQAFDGPTDDAATYDFHLSNVVIELVPTCDVPSVIPSPVTAITETGATVAWALPGTGTPNGYQYVFSTANTAPTEAGTGVTALTATTNTLSPSTNYYTWVRTSCASGFSAWVMVGAFRTKCDAPEILTTTGASRCGAGSVQLTATATTGANLTWYAAETGGTSLATGSTYSPSIGANTTFYVGASNTSGTIATAGFPAPTDTNATFNSLNYGVVFNVVDDVTINTVDVYSTTDGFVNVSITTSAGVELFQTGDVALVGGTGANTIPIEYSIAPGTNYRLLIKSNQGATLVRELSGASFPYNGTDGNLNVISSWNNGLSATTNYYFYNVRYTAGCQSARTAVTATVHNDANTPTGATEQAITAATPEEATIEDIVVTETGVIWYASSANAIAGVSPLAAGTQVFAGTTYYGALPVGSCVPLAVTITAVAGNEGFSKSQFTYYPNPVKDVLTLKYASEISGVEVYNLVGQKIMSKKFNATEANVDMEGIADGNYIVKVTSGDKTETIKIIKKN